MNAEGAPHRRPRPAQQSRYSETSTEPIWPVSRLIIEIPFESRGRVHIVADSHENELRMRQWLRRALARRQSLSSAISDWLDELDEFEAA